MSSDWGRWLSRWTDAGLVDAATAERIRAFEAVHGGSSRLRWPILIALAFGALMVSGGVLLFVAANWDELSPAVRFTLVLLLVSTFHLAAAVTAAWWRAMSETLHAIGTVALGAGIALSGQIFHLEEHWPAGIMVWAAGAALAWAILRHPSQLALVAILVPAWLLGEWVAAVQTRITSLEVPIAGALLLSLAYLNAVGPGETTRPRRTLMWIGGIGGTVSAIALAASNMDRRSFELPFTTTDRIAMAIGFAGPLLLAAALRGREAWTHGITLLWVAALVMLPGLDRGVATFGWWGLGAIGLVAWGVRDGRVERINLGAAAFAVTVLAFYFSRVMDKLGRSASLLTLGLLFLVGGWALERMRRRLVERSREAP